MNTSWQNTQFQIVYLTKIAARPYKAIQRHIYTDNIPNDILFNPLTKVGFVVGNNTDNTLKYLNNTLSDYSWSTSDKPIVRDSAYIFTKNANVTSTLGMLGGWLKGPMTLGFDASPFSATVASSLLGAGLGYGGGRLAEWLLPKRYIKRKHLPTTAAILGGILGAAPGVHAATINLRDNKSIFDQIGAGAKKDVFQQIKSSHYIGDVDNLTQSFDILLGFEAPDKSDFNNIADMYLRKNAANFDIKINKDGFNNVIWDDPFTPIVEKGIISGIVEGASQIANNSKYITPNDIARLTVGMGTGLASGTLVGKTLGALAGLTDEAQESLQRAGIWAGFIKNIVPMVTGVR